ncbi:MAG: hypothetical protein LBP65_01315 [Puniceicoccales bacterium]|jgi:hypothetical protein|nr:hypothetical protein [Puniceicoccales bacterium]
MARTATAVASLQFTQFTDKKSGVDAAIGGKNLPAPYPPHQVSGHLRANQRNFCQP